MLKGSKAHVTVNASYRYILRGGHEAEYTVIDITDRDYGVVMANGTSRRITFGSLVNRFSILIG